MEEVSNEPKNGGATNKTPSKTGLYSIVASHGKEVIAFLVARMNDENEQGSVRVSAANKLLDKMLANLNANDITADGMPFLTDTIKQINDNRGTNQPPAETTNSTPDPLTTGM